MSTHELFSRILGSLHAGALDDANWPATSGLIDELCGSTGNFLVIGDGPVQGDVDIFFTRFCFRGERDPGLERKYFYVYHALDERVPRLRRLPDSQLAPSRDLLTEKEKRTSVVYNGPMRDTGTRDSLNVRLDGPGGSRIVWTLADPVGDEGWSHARTEAIVRLLPHLRQHVCVRQALADAQALGSSASELLDNVRIGIIQLDRRGRVVDANDRARALLSRGDFISDAGGVLSSMSPRENADLQRLLARALPFHRGRGAGGSMVLRRPDSPAPLILQISPVSEEAMLMGWRRMGAIVLLVDPSRRTSADPDFVGPLLGLSPSESQIAVLLAEGRTVREIAAARRRTEASVRWHLKNVFARHGLSRQVDLVQLVRAAGDLAPEDRC